MLIYFFLLFYLYILSMLEVLKVKVPKIIKPFSMVLLIIIMGFRYEVGADYVNYVDIYSHIGWFVDTMEPGGILLMESLQSIGLNAQSFFLICSLLILLPISFCINKEIPDYFHLALCLYVISFLYFEAMNTVRQGVAMAFCFVALYEFRKGNRLLSILFVIFSFCFHKSSIVIVVLYFLFSFISYRRFIFLMLIAISFICGNFLIDFFSDYALLLMRSDYAVEKRGVSSGFFQIFLNVTSLILILFYNKYQKKSSEIVLFSKLYLVSIIIYNVFINFYVVLRLYFYFYMSLIVLIPYILTYQKRFVRILSFNIIFILLSLYSLVSLNNENYNKYSFNFDLVNIITSSK